MEKKVFEYDVVIIGGGAAGLTAGIYCGRARLKTLLIEKSLVGGLATYTSEIENYPGFPEPMGGTALMQRFEKQAKRLGVEFKLTDVKGLQVMEDGTKLVETFRAIYKAKAVILATGGKPRLTGARNEENFLYDKGISFCATCDAAYYTDKVVLMVGSGDAAIEEGMFLTKFAKKVLISVIHDQGILDANKIAQEQAFSNPKMEFIWNTMVDEFVGGERLTQVNLKNTKTGAIIPVEVDGCFLFIGYLPNTEIFKGLIALNDRGYIKTNEMMETNIAGVYAVGDVREKGLRQVSTAVGDGAVAAVAAERYLAENEYFQQLLQADRPSLFYVWEPTNEQCRCLLPVVEELKCKYGSTITVSKIDVYKSASLIQKVCKEMPENLPAVVLVKQGAPPEVIAKDLTPETLECCAQKLATPSEK
ncbi:thioredoxin reductase (NADPH) [Hydrogenispora ethanolica]|uniref:Thioredoxin reductase (NADPH) n=1 Tax=Hydrogenispora ethanolica TaxID=1082276 RepID=A0A4R1RSF1_HYDET|nr:FAD-dependent oxidoreductase [Hydrogenispora ethanolica]TCL69403.1 thioredoxin reductase (NADPH) [Hydrogenispora ethanolica]